MKKYIIVSIIVAVLFIGASLSVVKATTAIGVMPARSITPQTTTIHELSGLISGGLKLNYSTQLSGVSQADLSNVVENIIGHAQDQYARYPHLACCHQGVNVVNCWVVDSNGNTSQFGPCGSQVL